MPLDAHALSLLSDARHPDPFRALGCHREGDGRWWVRAWLRDAVTVRVARAGAEPIELAPRAGGLFEGPVADGGPRPDYELLVRREWHPDEERRERDPYAFGLLLNEWDLERFREGSHHDIADILGAVVQDEDGCPGTRFAVWAPNAEAVSVIGDWNGYDARWHPLRLRHPYGVWELFVPGVGAGAHYKFSIRGRGGQVRIKADPYARACEVPPATASIVAPVPAHQWGDDAWMANRDGWGELPMAIYECHIGSWRRSEEDGPLSYRELAPLLIEHCRGHGFTHVEFLPLAAHPYEGSWGYQVTGQYAPNSRHGSADDLRYLVDQLHQADIGVIVDYVPAHFPKDDFALALFDGHPCYEYADPREGEHRDWGTLIFNYRRPEVRNYLIGAALFWLRDFHIDGLRVDAVSSMLYRNYSREEGEWVANEEGGHANLEAMSFLRELNERVRTCFPGVVTIAEESTSWQGVTAPSDHGGLGFDLKWNMGWMHDTLRYLDQDPVMRAGVHDWITFHQWYAYDERWVLPLSHDEVVHGKHSLIDKMPGDYIQRLAQLRLLYAWQAAIPGRPLLFMGAEFGQGHEWAWQRGLDWHEAELDERRGLGRCLAAALACYRDQAALYRADDSRDGFSWADVENRQESILAFLRHAPDAAPVLAVFNFTPVARSIYPIGVPAAGPWRVLLSTTAAEFGGDGYGPQVGEMVATTDEHRDGWAGVIRPDLGPFAALLLTPAE
jgi:1,4-alpha-glucan branching enzyme